MNLAHLLQPKSILKYIHLFASLFCSFEVIVTQNAPLRNIRCIFNCLAAGTETTSSYISYQKLRILNDIHCILNYDLRP